METCTTTCGPIPGGLILTHSHLDHFFREVDQTHPLQAGRIHRLEDLNRVDVLLALERAVSDSLSGNQRGDGRPNMGKGSPKIHTHRIYKLSPHVEEKKPGMSESTIPNHKSAQNHMLRTLHALAKAL